MQRCRKEALPRRQCCKLLPLSLFGVLKMVESGRLRRGVLPDGNFFYFELGQLRLRKWNHVSGGLLLS